MNHILPKLLSVALLVTGLTAAHGALADHRGDNTVLTDIPQIVSWFAEIIAPCHRRGNEIIFAAA